MLSYDQIRCGPVSHHHHLHQSCFSCHWKLFPLIKIMINCASLISFSNDLQAWTDPIPSKMTYSVNGSALSGQGHWDAEFKRWPLIIQPTQLSLPILIIISRILFQPYNYGSMSTSSEHEHHATLFFLFCFVLFYFMHGTSLVSDIIIWILH